VDYRQTETVRTLPDDFMATPVKAPQAEPEFTTPHRPTQKEATAVTVRNGPGTIAGQARAAIGGTMQPLIRVPKVPRILFTVLLMLAGLVFAAASPAAAAPRTAAVQAHAVNPRAETMSQQVAQPKRVHPNACGFSQVWTPGNIYPPGSPAEPLWPCDGLYVNCYTTGSSYNGDVWWEWVSWTSRYGYTWQGWVPDYIIETFNNPPSVYWGHC
jgi:hypothetical protein